MNPAPFPPGRWRARWIWAADAPRERHVVALRRRFELARVPEAAPGRWCAVGRCAVWLNGAEVGRGPVRANPRRQPWDDRDLAGWLRPGTNTLCVLAWHYGGPAPWYLPGPPVSTDLVGGAFVFEARLGEEWLVSDAGWSARRLPGWGGTRAGGVTGRGRERVDARALPADWLETDPGWPAAIERRAVATGEPGRSEPPSYPYGPYGPRPIGWPEPADLPLEPGAAGAWHLERIGVGTLRLEAHGPAGAELVVRAAEFLGADGEPAPTDHDASLAFTLDGTRRGLESVDLYGLRACRVEAPPGVTVHGVTLRERTYPVAGSASFACSDPRLDRIWAVGRRSVTINSTDAYTDCPTREQRAWTGDSVVHQLVDLTTNADWRLARYHPVLAASPRPDGMLPMAVAGDAEHSDFTIIPDWALHWIHSLWNLQRYVGDPEEIAALMPAAEGVLRWFLPFVDGQGLPRDVPGWVIIDWASVYTEGVCGPLCGLWGRALLEFAELAEWLGDAGRAGWARRIHARLVRGFEALWDPARQRYVDSMPGAERRPTASQHGQAAAIVGRLAPEARWPRLVELLVRREDRVHASFSVPDGPSLPNAGIPIGGAYLVQGHPEPPWWDVDGLVAAQPFFRYVVHDALALAGRADLVADQCLDWTVALERCDSSLTETWYGGTVSHGWGATPTRDLMQRVLGVTPAEPGFGVARVDPALGGLDWARGAIAHPRGEIHVEVEGDVLRVASPVDFVHHGRRFAAGRHEIRRREARS